MASVDWEVGPTKDVVEALIEALVDPKLHSRVSKNDPPCENTEKSIARQMHAVVLLYNYYHRKQKLELEFLDFESFSKLAMSLRPSLIPFMKTINRSESVGLEDQLSVTEKAIKDACNIAVSLDASRDAPSIEGHPISKVAVLLIDSKKENCFLQFGAVTEGVWSLLEKEINEEILEEENVSKKRKRNSQKASNDCNKFLQLGYNVVKDVTGIDSSDLAVFETHVVYSLSKEKSAAQFYMMLCSQSFDKKQSVPLKFLIESLNGPLADKFLDSWSTTDIVKYFHMLPYVGSISDWLPRKESCLSTLNGLSAPSKLPSLPQPEDNGEDIDTISFEANDNSEDNQEKSKHSSGGKDVSSMELFLNPKKRTSVGKVASSVKFIPSTKNHGNIAEKSTKRINLEKDGEEHERGSLFDPSRGLSQSVGNDDNALQRIKMNDFTTSSFKAEERKKVNSKPGAYHQRKENVPSLQWIENVASAQHDTKEDNALQRTKTNDFTTSSFKTEERKKVNSKPGTYHQRKENVPSLQWIKNVASAQHDTPSPEGGVNLKVKKPELVKSNGSLCRDENATAEKPTLDSGDVDISLNQSGTVSKKEVVRFELSHNIEVQNAFSSEDLGNALALLDRKSHELYSQICTMEDKLASYEYSIERIRDGGDIEFARKCINFILTGSDDLLLKNELQVQDMGLQPGDDHTQSQTKTGFSCTFLPGKSSCQDLEYMCHKNNWRLPRYFVQPSDGKFISNVVVQSKDFSLSSEGGSECSPYEARESAAAHMMAQIRDACANRSS